MPGLRILFIILSGSEFQYFDRFTKKVVAGHQPESFHVTKQRSAELCHDCVYLNRPASVIV